MKVKRVRWFRRWCVALVICGASTASALAQQQSEISAPSIEVLKLKWEKQIRLPRNFDPSIIPANRTFNDLSPRTSTSPADAVRTATQARNDASAATTSFPATPARLPVFYLYSMKVRNIGAKRIEGVAWDYLFIDSISNSKVGSHQFLSYEKVAPGKTVTFQRQMRSPPTRVVDASDKKGQRPKFIERAVIQCVLYADDTLWRSPQAREGVCDLLKKSKAVVKRKRTAA